MTRITIEELHIIEAIDYLESDSQTHDLIRELEDAGPCLIFGGALRDWIAGKPPRDIDIVIDTTPEKLEFLSKKKGRKTAFGGYSVRCANSLFDIWDLKSTWAFKNDSSFAGTFEEVPKTAFLNTDCIVFDLTKCALYKEIYDQAMSTKELDIVYEPNPFPRRASSKALATAVKYDLQPSDRLKKYVRDQLDTGYEEKHFNRFKVDTKCPYAFEECLERFI